MVNETDSREDLVIPMINEEPGQFWHVTIPPGKRHLIQILVATPRVALSWKFTTEKKVNTYATYNLQNSLFLIRNTFYFVVLHSRMCSSFPLLREVSFEYLCSPINKRCTTHRIVIYQLNRARTLHFECQSVILHILAWKLSASFSGVTLGTRLKCHIAAIGEKYRLVCPHQSVTKIA